MKIKFQNIVQFISDKGGVTTEVLPLSGEYFEIDEIAERDPGREIKIAGGATNVAAGLGQVDSPKLLIIVVMDGTLNLKVNSTSAPIMDMNIAARRITETFTKYGVFLITTDTSITELYFTNAGSDTAKVKIFMAS